MSTDGPRRTATDRGISLQHSRTPALTYEHFYGLKEKPFSLSSDPTFFYNSNAHSTAFEALLSGINRRESLSVLSGDIGMGKTTLCRSVLQHLDRQTLSAFVPDPFASREDLLKVVLVDFGIVSADDLASGRLRGASRTELSYLLYEFLDTLAPLQAFAVIFIDEAQNLSVPLLEEIRILSESDGRGKALQVVLVGQLELQDKLRLPEMRQVAQRVTVRCTLGGLDRDGVAGYISHRLHIAGGAPDRVRFSHEAIDAVYEASAGVPRVINRLCDRALHHAHTRRAAVVDPVLVRMAAAEVDPGALTMPVVRPAALPPPEADAPVVTPVIEDAVSEDAVSEEPAVVEPAARPGPTPELSDTWLETVDAYVSSAEPADPADITTIAELVAASRPHGRERSGPIPLTHMEALRRRWFRRFKIAALFVIILGGAGFGLSLAYGIITGQTVTPVVHAPAPAPAKETGTAKKPDADANQILTQPITVPRSLEVFDY